METKQTVDTPRATIGATTKEGYSVLMTISAEMSNKEILELVEKVGVASTSMANEEMTAPVKNGFGNKPSFAKPLPTTDAKCPKCGAEMKISKAGKPYCSALCWKQGQSEY